LTPFLFGNGNIFDKISSPVSSYRSKIPNVDYGVRCIASGFLQMFLPLRETRDYLPRSIRFERLMYPDLAYRQSLLCMTCATWALSAAFFTSLYAPFKLQLRAFSTNPKKLSSKNILLCLGILFRSLSYSSSVSQLCHATALSTGTINHTHIMTEQRRNLGTEENIRYERRALSIRSKRHYIHPISI
jgi:hypothetical protein